ncbi:MRN complex-interacting protein isoform X2 [Carica papaya]|uniref:MRN complex-interacting protein isoform X2 n=1 Tax=Carica papaya TaxID=3649 RepID=UPI000B8CB298|nr:MRN complex-interacting protein isoform X2 [Carica papaya]
MPSSIFIALQCCQCSIMQVKQRRKSSNKWTCVVCNQKQSVKKVFAQGHVAKDLRLFVQSFNISRKATDCISFNNNDNDNNNTGLAQGSERKRRTDWREYLDLPDPNQKLNQEEEGGDFERRVVTELPKEMLKKPKLKKYGGGSGNGESDDDKEVYKPVFPKRNNINKHDNKMNMKTSKWNGYMTIEDDGLLLGTREEDEVHPDFGLLLGTKVEDEVHPDFM